MWDLHVNPFEANPFPLASTLHLRLCKSAYFCLDRNVVNARPAKDSGKSLRLTDQQTPSYIWAFCPSQSLAETNESQNCLGVGLSGPILTQKREVTSFGAKNRGYVDSGGKSSQF